MRTEEEENRSSGWPSPLWEGQEGGGIAADSELMAVGSRQCADGLVGACATVSGGIIVIDSRRLFLAGDCRG